MSKISDSLAQLGVSMGLESLQMNESGACRLIFDGQIHVDIEPSNTASDTLLIHAVVGSVPPENKGNFFRRLLDANYLKKRTSGGVLAIDPMTEEVVLWREVDVQTNDVAVLSDELIALVVSAREWSEHLPMLLQEGEEKRDDGDASDASLMRV